MIDREAFFKEIRPNPFGGKLDQNTVIELGIIIDEWEKRNLTDLRKLAYMMATNLGECGRNLKPVREGFRKTDSEARAFVKRRGYRYAKVVNGHVYYGRGRVQLTWDFNYKKAGEELKVDLLNNPDLALDSTVATQIMFLGMEEGWFTGKKLDNYFTKTFSNWNVARKIINGTDRAAEIGGYAQMFYKALTKE